MGGRYFPLAAKARVSWPRSRPRMGSPVGAIIDGLSPIAPLGSDLDRRARHPIFPGRLRAPGIDGRLDALLRSAVRSLNVSVAGLFTWLLPSSEL